MAEIKNAHQIAQNSATYTFFDCFRARQNYVYALIEPKTKEVGKTTTTTHTHSQQSDRPRYSKRKSENEKKVQKKLSIEREREGDGRKCPKTEERRKYRNQIGVVELRSNGIFRFVCILLKVISIAEIYHGLNFSPVSTSFLLLLLPLITIIMIEAFFFFSNALTVYGVQLDWISSLLIYTLFIFFHFSDRDKLPCSIYFFPSFN